MQTQSFDASFFSSSGMLKGTEGSIGLPGTVLRLCQTVLPSANRCVRFLSSPLQNPGFPRVFRISGQLLWLSCTSMQVHACTCCVV